MELPMTLIREKYLKRGRIMDLPMTLMTGGIHEVEGKENSLKIDGLARFAVEEHNKKENAMVQFVKVVNAKEQVVAGMMYYITIEATDGGVKKLYEAKVWLMEWMNFKEVQEFKLVRDAPGEAEVWMREWMNFKEEWLNFKEVTEFKPVGDTAPGEASA